MTRTHGKSNKKEYRAWEAMRARCRDANRWDFHHYGGRGIAVCDKWKASYVAFRDDMGPKPPGTSLDRINNDGPYSPENCRWADVRTQRRNTRGTKLNPEAVKVIRHLRGVNNCLMARLHGVTAPLVRQIRAGTAWSDEGGR
jgi:hypothetical protein